MKKLLCVLLCILLCAALLCACGTPAAPVSPQEPAVPSAPQAPAVPEKPTEPETPADPMPEMYGESVSGALDQAVPFSEKKITLPKKKVSFKLKPSANKEAYIVKNTGDMPLADEEEGLTVGSVDSGYVPQFFSAGDEKKS